MKGNSTYDSIQWPVKATLSVNLANNNAESVQITDSTGLLLLCKCTNAQEAKDLAALLNWLNDYGNNADMQLGEKNVLIGELEKIKSKYHTLLKKLDEEKPVNTDKDTQTRAMTNADKDEARVQQILDAPARMIGDTR